MERLKCLRRVLMITLCTLVIAVAAALAGSRISIKNVDDYGFVYSNELGLAEQQSLIVTTTPSQVFIFDVASRVGGVILQATAQPDPPSAEVNILYDSTLQDGNRFKITIGGESSGILAPDWVIIPLIWFVDSGQTAAMSLLGNPKNEAEIMWRALSNFMFIEIHPALRDTVLGNNFIFTDAMLVGGTPDRIRGVTEALSAPIPGYSDLAVFNEGRSEQAAKQLKHQLSKGGWNSYIFTDVDVHVTFSIRGRRLEFTGQPYYAFLLLDAEKKTITRNDELTRMLQGSGVFWDLNPKIYELNRRAFQLTALLRYFRTAHNEQWHALLNAVLHQTPVPSMSTPRAWEP